MARYPLEAARTVRATARERAERALAEAVRAQSQAKAIAVAAVEALGRFRSAKRDPDRSEASTNGAALHREAAFRERIDRKERALVEELRAAATEERRRANETQEAKRALVDASVQEKVVDRHHERWAKTEKRAAERAEERELEEVSRT